MFSCSTLHSLGHMSAPSLFTPSTSILLIPAKKPPGGWLSHYTASLPPTVKLAPPPQPVISRLELCNKDGARLFTAAAAIPPQPWPAGGDNGQCYATERLTFFNIMCVGRAGSPLLLFANKWKGLQWRSQIHQMVVITTFLTIRNEAVAWLKLHCMLFN